MFFFFSPPPLGDDAVTISNSFSELLVNCQEKNKEQSIGALKKSDNLISVS